MKFYYVQRNTQLERIPLLEKEGWLRHQSRSREATEEPQTGWSLTQHVSEMHSETPLVSDHPRPRLFRNGSILLMAQLLLRLRPIGLALRALLCKGNALQVNFICASKIIWDSTLAEQNDGASYCQYSSPQQIQGEPCRTKQWKAEPHVHNT